MAEQLSNHEAGDWRQTLRDFIKEEFSWDDKVIDDIIEDTLVDTEIRAKWESFMAQKKQSASG